MSQSTNFEAAEARASVISGITSDARDARSALSEEFSKDFRDAFRKLTAPNPDASQSLDNILPKPQQGPHSDSSSPEVPTPGTKSESLSEAIKNAARDSLNGKFDVSDKERRMAKEQLSKGLSDLIPEADRKLLTQLQGAVIDGDVAGLKAGFKQLADDPAKMEKFMNTLNSQLEGVAFSKDSQGNVLMYEKNGNTALSINPSTGETSLRAVERQADGSVLLKPGEIINRNVAGVAKSLGDEVTRNLNGLNHHYDWKSELLNGLKNSGSLNDIRPLNDLRPKQGLGSLLDKSPIENSATPPSVDKPKNKIEK